MPGRRCLPFLFLAISACQAPPPSDARQHVVEWPESHRVFVADRRLGRVQSFRLPPAGAPVLSAQTPALLPTSLRDIRLDPARGQLWVLSGAGVSVYEALTLDLQQQIALDARRAWSLRIDADSVLLIDAQGVPVDRIDRATQVVARLAPPPRG